ncbi:hypothetical protein Tco_0436604 [Tanacetum coccineum]
MTKAKDQRSQSMKEQAYNVDRDKDHKSSTTNLIDLTMECHNGLTSEGTKFWATATVYHHSIHFKMTNKKHIVNLEYFREMLQICPKLPDQQFEEPPFEEEIHMFRRDRCQILWGMYHKEEYRTFYLLWEDFVYQVENKNVKRSNEMYYPRFTMVIVNFFMTKDSSIPRRNRVNWHFARDDSMFTTIKVVSRHEDTQLYGAILLDELTNEAIKDSESYKEYYAIASGAEPPKTKASVKKKQAGSDKTNTPLIAKGKRLKTSAKSSDKEDDDDDNDDNEDNDDDDDENDDVDDDADNQDDEGQDNDNEKTDSDNDDEEDNEEEGSNLRVQTPSHYESTDDEESNKVTHGTNVEGEELDE